MKTYVSLGIGDACCIESLLGQEARDSISELYFACRFGKHVAPLFENNPYYPKLVKCHFIDDQIGYDEMERIDPGAGPYWHFRCDFPERFNIGKRLFGLENETKLNVIDAFSMFSSNKPFINSSFLDNAKLADVQWAELEVEPFNYLLFHYPTSTRPRSDIASITEQDWAYVEKRSQETKLTVLIVTDVDINSPLSNYKILKNRDIKELVALSKYQYEFFGCDSFLAILSSKILPVEKLHVKSHKSNIQTEILSNLYQQTYFRPKTGEEIARFYKNSIS